jgi:hypothetical protein
MSSQLGSRLSYNNAKEAINRAGISAGKAVLSQSYLRLEVALQANKTLYQFPILQNDNTNGAAFNTENRLALQDAFYVSSMGLFFAAPASATSSEFQLCTYPNTTQFTAGSAASLFSFYNSSLSLIVNNRQIIPSYDLYRHYSVPQQQQVVDADYTGSNIDYKDQQDGSNSGFYPIEPGWVIVGSKNNTLQVSLPNALANVQANSRAVIIFRGHLAQNVTPVR